MPLRFGWRAGRRHRAPSRSPTGARASAVALVSRRPVRCAPSRWRRDHGDPADGDLRLVVDRIVAGTRGAPAGRACQHGARFRREPVRAGPLRRRGLEATQPRRIAGARRRETAGLATTRARRTGRSAGDVFAAVRERRRHPAIAEAGESGGRAVGTRVAAVGHQCDPRADRTRLCRGARRGLRGRRRRPAPRIPTHAGAGRPWRSFDRLARTAGGVENIEGQGEAALQLTREALKERIATWGPDDPRVGVGYNDVASALEGLERYGEAIPMWEKTYRFELAHFGPDSNETTLAMAGWASAEWRAGHWTEAHKLFTQALGMYAGIGGKPQVTRVYAAQKACVLDGTRADRASAAQDCALAQKLSSEGFGAGTPLHGDSLEAAAFGEIEAGDFERAKALLEQARKLYGDAPANRMRVGRADSELAGIALLEGQPALARGLLPNAIEGLRTRGWKVPPLIAEARLLLACTQSPGPQCPAGLQAAVELDFAAVAGRRDPMLLWVQTPLAEVDLLHHEPAIARARLADAVRHASVELQPSHPRRLVAELWLALATAQAGDCTGAVAQAQAARAVIETNGLAAHPELAGVRAALRRPAGSCGVLMH